MSGLAKGTSQAQVPTWDEAKQAFVLTAGLVSSTKTGTTYVLAAVDMETSVRRSNASANTTTIPLNSVVPLPIGFICIINQAGVGQSSVIKGNASITFNSTLLNVNGPGTALCVSQVAIDEWDIIGGVA